MMENDPLWVERYRPRTISETILPKRLKSIFEKMVQEKNVPNMILAGSAGLGKTTIARALCSEMNLDYIFINGSDERNIDTLRNKIRQFASTVSLTGNLKVVILDEADYLNPQSTQPALRGFMEEFHKNCRFILTCNFKNKIIEPLHSRCSVYDFTYDAKEMPELCAQFFKRITSILEENNVTYDKATLASLIQKHMPDWRRILNECQRYSIAGSIDEGILRNFSQENFEVLINALREKQFNTMRKWVTQNMDMGPTAIMRKLYDHMTKFVKPESTPQLVLILAEYDYKNAFVADAELNLVACLTEIMGNVKFI